MQKTYFTVETSTSGIPETLIYPVEDTFDRALDLVFKKMNPHRHIDFNGVDVITSSLALSTAPQPPDNWNIYIHSHPASDPNNPYKHRDNPIGRIFLTNEGLYANNTEQNQPFVHEFFRQTQQFLEGIGVTQSVRDKFLRINPSLELPTVGPETELDRTATGPPELVPQTPANQINRNPS